MFHRRIVSSAALVLALLATAGCASSAKAYVTEHFQGYQETRGTIEEVHGASWRTYEVLSDGFALQIGKSGCKVRLSQTEDHSETFELVPGDHIVVSTGEYSSLLTKLKPTTATPDPIPAEPGK